MDIKLRFNSSSTQADINCKESDLELDYGLATSVLISMYTDKRANDDDDIPDGTENKRGWWGDSISEYDEDQIGSRLWLLERSKVTNDVMNKAYVYLLECLDWMTEDGIVRDLSVEVGKKKFSPDGSYVLTATITLYKNDGRSLVLKFEDLWEGQYAME